MNGVSPVFSIDQAKQTVSGIGGFCQRNRFLQPAPGIHALTQAV
jgi:hypothetical protein